MFKTLRSSLIYDDKLSKTQKYILNAVLLECNQFPFRLDQGEIQRVFGSTLDLMPSAEVSFFRGSVTQSSEFADGARFRKTTRAIHFPEIPEAPVKH